MTKWVKRKDFAEIFLPYTNQKLSEQDLRD